jgi:hypothetical protein
VVRISVSGAKVDRLGQVNVEELQRSLELCWKEKSILKEENYDMKKTIRTFLQLGMKVPDNISLDVPEERPLSWAEKSERFEPLLHAICECVLELTKQDGRPVHYDKMERWISLRYTPLYKSLKQPSGTIAARARDLRRDGFLQTPEGEQAVFLPGPKLMKERS